MKIALPVVLLGMSFAVMDARGHSILNVWE